MLAFVGVVALVLTYLIVTGQNPLPGIGKGFTDALGRFRSLSDPQTAWTQRLDDQPTSVTVAGQAVVFGTRTGAEVRDARDGRVLWTRAAPWTAVAGDGASAMVVVGKGRDSGYDVVDPVSGAVRWRDAGLGVWTYRDALLSLACPAGRDCALSSRSIADGRTGWTVGLPAGARLLAGAHPSTGNLPPLLGLPVDGRITVVNTANGGRPRDEASSATTRVAVVGGRIIRSSTARTEGHCRYTVEGRDAASGRQLWRREGYDLGTVSGAGCDQRRDPAGAQRVLVATRGDNRPVILSTTDGRELWAGAPGESVVVVDDRDAVVRSGDSIALVGLDGGGTRWAKPAPGDVALTPYAVVVTDPASGRLVAYGRSGGAALAEVESQASVLGAGPNGLILARGRTVGLLKFRADP
ncbi:hypothetical protein Pme01_49250 [Planosporangium mesophilum]|uniref:Uncharacterized protein n=1 Tax=Planosporangium mesophilum TaxID=689768 RepID=A0A8J3TEG0_9ACTN|nr:hypothetical protein Pme01_49250 [Planosporangium mesophilum]